MQSPIGKLLILSYYSPQWKDMIIVAGVPCMKKKGRREVGCIPLIVETLAFLIFVRKKKDKQKACCYLLLDLVILAQ